MVQPPGRGDLIALANLHSYENSGTMDDEEKYLSPQGIRQFLPSISRRLEIVANKIAKATPCLPEDVLFAALIQCNIDDLQALSSHFACVTTALKRKVPPSVCQATAQALYGTSLIKHLTIITADFLARLEAKFTTPIHAGAVTIYSLLISVLWWLMSEKSLQQLGLPMHDELGMARVVTEAVQHGLLNVLLKAQHLFPATQPQILEEGLEVTTVLKFAIVLVYAGKIQYPVPSRPGYREYIAALRESRFLQASCKALVRGAEAPEILIPAYAIEQCMAQQAVDLMVSLSNFCDEYLQQEDLRGYREEGVRFLVSELVNDPYVVQLTRLITNSILALESHAWPSTAEFNITPTFNLSYVIKGTKLRQPLPPPSVAAQQRFAADGAQGLAPTRGYLPVELSVGPCLTVLDAVTELNEEWAQDLQLFVMCCRLRRITGLRAEWPTPQSVIKRLSRLPEEGRSQAATAVTQVTLDILKALPAVFERLPNISLDYPLDPPASTTNGRHSNMSASTGNAKSSSTASNNGTSASNGGASPAASASHHSSSPSTPAIGTDDEIRDVIRGLGSMMHGAWHAEYLWLDERSRLLLWVVFGALDVLVATLTTKRLLQRDRDVDLTHHASIRQAVLQSHGPQLLPVIESLMRRVPFHGIHLAVASLLGAVVAAAANPAERKLLGPRVEADVEAALLTSRKFLAHTQDESANAGSERRNMAFLLDSVIDFFDEPLRIISSSAGSFKDSVRLAAHRLAVQMRATSNYLEQLGVRGCSQMHEALNDDDLLVRIHANGSRPVMPGLSLALSMSATGVPSLGCWHAKCKNMSGNREADLVLLKCGRCRHARYCCQACQAQDWGGASGHKGACKILAEQPLIEVDPLTELYNMCLGES